MRLFTVAIRSPFIPGSCYHLMNSTRNISLQFSKRFGSRTLHLWYVLKTEISMELWNFDFCPEQFQCSIAGHWTLLWNRSELWSDIVFHLSVRWVGIRFRMSWRLFSLIASSLLTIFNKLFVFFSDLYKTDQVLAVDFNHSELMARSVKWSCYSNFLSEVLAQIAIKIGWSWQNLPIGAGDTPPELGTFWQNVGIIIYMHLNLYADGINWWPFISPFFDRNVWNKK